jgi:Fe(3+) dicitrate transport protein
MNTDMQTDAGKARIYGLEAFAHSDLRYGQTTIPLNLAYTYTNAEFLSDFASSDPILGTVRKGDEVPYVPTHLLNALAGIERPRWGVTVSGSLMGRMREAPGQGPMLPQLTTDQLLIFDMMANANVAEGLQVYLAVRNALDEVGIVSRRPFSARPNSPRWVQLGLRGTL